MANIKVNTDILQHVADEEQSISNRLTSIENDIKKVALRMDTIKVSYSALIKKALNESGNGVASERDKLLNLARALEEIRVLYEKTEKDSQNRSEVDDNKNHINQIFSNIRDAAECLGMDNFAEYSSDPVNLATGNYVYEKTIMDLHTALDLKFRIFYNVQLNTKGTLGKGWIHNSECHLEFRGNHVIFVDDDSSEKVFFKKESGIYDTALKQNGVLEKTEKGYLMKDRDGILWKFNEHGHLIEKCDFIGNKNLFFYDEKGRLKQVTDQNDHGFRFSYEDSGLLTAVEDHTGRKVLISYEAGRLAGIIAPGNRKISFRYDREQRLNKIVNSEDVVVLQNEYDTNDRTIKQIFADGGVVSYAYIDDLNQVEMTEQNGNQVIYEHDSLKRNTKTYYKDSTESSEFDHENQRIAYTDRRGHTTRYGYDENGMLSEIITPLQDSFHIEYTGRNQLKGISVNGKMLYKANYNEKNLQESIENPCGGKAKFEYNDKNQLVKYIQEDGSSVGLEYDEMGNVAALVDPMGGRTSYSYDDLQRVIATVDAKGNKTSYLYNEADELIQVRNAEGNIRTYQYDACGNVICFTDYNGGITKITYNDMNRVTSATDPDGSVTKYEYDAMWNVQKETAPDGGETYYEYDQMHHLTGITGADGNKETAEYDACGNLIRRTDASGAQHKIQYDELNRPIAIEDPNGRVTSAKYDALGNVIQVVFPDESVESTTYDLMGNPLSFTDRGGYTKLYRYDRMGNLTEIFDKFSWLTRLEYYPGGLLKKESNIDGTSWEYWYDANQNVETLMNQDGFSWKFEYDSLDQLTVVSNSEGLKEQYEYDAVGNVTAVIMTDGSRTEYTYSAAGTLTEMVDALGNKTRYFYDGCRRLTEILQTENAGIDVDQINCINKSNKQIRITAYRYDKAGHMVSWIDPEGNQTAYHYDECGRLCSRIDAEGNWTRCEYNPDGTEKGYYFSDGKSIQMQYNALRQLTELKDWTGITQISSDVMGRPLKVTDPQGRTLQYEWGERGEKRNIIYPNGDQIRYSYDNALRLTACHLVEDVIHYTYLDNGQLCEKSGPGELLTTYKYNAAGRISGLRYMDGKSILDDFTYEYDKNGRRVGMDCKRSDMGECSRYEYEYDALGSLSHVWKNGVEEEAYRYDSFGNRIWSRVRGVETQYIYNRLDQLTDLHRQGEERHYAYQKNGNLASEWRNGSLFCKMQYNVMDRMILVEMPEIKKEYAYNGFGLRIGERLSGSIQRNKEFVYDITKDCYNLMSMQNGEAETNYFWDSGLIGESSWRGMEYYFCGPQMTPLRVNRPESKGYAVAYDSFGCLTGFAGKGECALGYTGYHVTGNDGFAYAYQRDYEPENGRFLSRDPIVGAITVPLAFNAYNYCLGDPVNRYDPTGALATWLASGIVGAISNIAVKAAGDVVNSVKNGKVTVSSWQSYVGTATGGFVSGTVYVASGGNSAAAEAAGSAVETFTSNGLNMISGTDGYTKADGYSWKNLMGDTFKSGVNGFKTGATTGFIFSKASKVTKYLKIPSITQGRNSMSAVFITQVKRAAHGYIKNISGKTIMKGLISMGTIKFFDEIVVKGKKAVEDGLKEKGKEILQDFLNSLRNDEKTTSVVNAKKYLTANAGSAECPAAGA